MPKARTILIYDECGQNPIKFLVMPEDLSVLDGTYVNTYTEDAQEQAKQEQLSNLIESNRHRLLASFPVKACDKDATVIVCGFLP